MRFGRLGVLVAVSPATCYLGFPAGLGFLRIEIHVQGRGDAGSEAFVNSPVLAPGAILLGGVGLDAAGLIVRWRKTTQA